MSDLQSLRERLQRKSIEVPKDRLRPKSPESAKPGSDAKTLRRVNRNIEYQAIKGDLHERLIDELNQQGALVLSDSELKPLISEFVTDVLETEDWPLNENERGRLASDLLEETRQ